MKFKRTSWHARLYNFTYSKHITTQTNLCPYGRKIILALLILIPNFILQLPMMLAAKYYNDKYDSSEESRITGTLYAYVDMFVCICDCPYVHGDVSMLLL